MKRCLILCAISSAAIAAVAVPAGTGAAPRRSPQVLCVDKHNDLSYRSQPRACTFHKRHAPFANAFEVITRHDLWIHGNRHRAKARGKAVASMTGPVPVRIKLYRARHRCGHLVYTKARFRFPSFHSRGSFKLDVCP
jgi:hypothetical protein